MGPLQSNLTDALIELRKLHEMGIEVCAIEQPLDLSIPESKAMLALYLAIPEIDNDRRSMKIRGGMRAALKDGRWCRVAPRGYRNSRDPLNKPIIVPDKTTSKAVKHIFELASEESPSPTPSRSGRPGAEAQPQRAVQDASESRLLREDSRA